MSFLQPETWVGLPSEGEKEKQSDPDLNLGALQLAF